MASHHHPPPRWPQAKARLGQHAWAPGNKRLWQVVLLALVFASLHTGLLSAWTAWKGQAPWVQICTTEGMRWVTGEDPGQETPSTLNASCVWAQAHLALPTPPAPLAARPKGHTKGATTWVAHSGPVPDTPSRVLLMAPMRAPPSNT